MKVKQKGLLDRDTIRIYILTTLMIMSSKTVFFGIIHMRETLMITLVSLILVMVTHNEFLYVKKKLLQIFFSFTCLLIGVSLFYIRDILSEFNSYIGAIVHFIEVLIIGMLYVSIVPKKKFIISYVHVMFALACISIVYFILSITDQSGALSNSSIYVSGSSSYMALPWYTFGWQTTMSNGYIYNYIFGRNAGPFWEPGAFQGFLYIGLFLLLRYKEWFRHRTLLVVVYLFTLLTTQSTTAYILLLFSLIGFGADYVECLFGKTGLKDKKRQIKYFTYAAAIIFALLLAYLILMSGNIANKFAADNGSLMDRTTDIQTALSVMFYNPIAGVGLGKTGLTLVNAQTVSATTLLALAEYFGIPFMIYYAYRFFKGCFALYEPNEAIKKLVLLVSFFLVLMSETLYLLPLYAVILFSTEFKRNRSTSVS